MSHNIFASVASCLLWKKNCWLNLSEEMSSILPLFLARRRQSRIPMIKMMRMKTAAAADPAMIVVGGPLVGDVGDGAENRHMNTEWEVEKSQENT